MWQAAMDLVEQIYLVTDGFPRREWYGLTGQIRRAAVSVPSNIAEGKGRNSDADYLRFLFIARGSLMEIETQITLARRLRYTDHEGETAILRQTATIGSGLTGLINSLREMQATAN